jgi:hypothetical protein
MPMSSSGRRNWPREFLLNCSRFLARTTIISDVQLPITVQRSPLNLSLPQKNIQCCSHQVRALPKLFCQIPLADHNFSGWETMVNFAAVERDFVRNRPEFSFFLSSAAFSPCLICFETALAGDSSNSEGTRDHCARSPVLDNPGRNSDNEVHYSNALDRLMGTCQTKLRRPKA